MKLVELIVKIPAEAWAGLVGVMIGAFVSVFGVWLSNRSNRQLYELQYENEKKEKYSNLRREKLEELYSLIDRWHKLFFKDFLNLSLVMKGNIDYNQYLDMLIDDGKTNNFDFSKLQMIVGVYGNELEGSYKNVMSLREKVNDIHQAHKQAYLDGEDHGLYLQPFAEAHRLLGNSVDDFKTEIAKTAKRA